jgi:hypothetical protein
VTYCTASRGCFGLFKLSITDSPGSGFEWVDLPPNRLREIMLAVPVSSEFGFVGFRYRSSPVVLLLEVPSWFPTLASALGLIWAWRRTGVKPKGGAFPVAVEVSKEGT